MAEERRQNALEIRIQAAKLAKKRDHPTHKANGDEDRYPETLIGSFTKGLPHEKETGLLSNPADFADFVRAINTGAIKDMRRLKLGIDEDPRFISGIASKGDKHPFADTRAWESMAAGLTYDLEGPDAQAVTMPPAPKLDSDELVTEITESYWMALLRDVPFTEFERDGNTAAAAASISRTRWVQYNEQPSQRPSTLTDEEIARLRGPYTKKNVFRGVTNGENVGPYLSQFLLVGTKGIGDAQQVSDGYVQYGGMRMDQRVRVAVPKRDYMTTWASWLDVQNAGDLRGREIYDDDTPFRFITTPRDLATWVHFDALYQAYLNACIILLDIKAPFDPHIPFQADDDVDKQQGFATFGGPHILSLCTEVATRALKAVRFQKYNLHRRLRPEAIGGLVERFKKTNGDPKFAPVKKLVNDLDGDMLRRVEQHNCEQNKLSDDGHARREDYSPEGESSQSYLLPMAFPEGSPMHPSYGAGHATVAGACVTVLKAFFDHEYELDFCYVPTTDGKRLEKVNINEKLTVEGELNKLCANISIGRNWAGVHYYSDYFESIKVGEEIAIGILQEQKLTYGEDFFMTLPKFDGEKIRI
uniref:Vanadium-dependent haloperoxidase n=1 Tax=Asparagopsis taxiformis TaxID=260499 RepID=A0A6M8Q946_9FLOR|nr:vanadium-dependent haloperoxidase [Asparagopsis taxiformis]